MGLYIYGRNTCLNRLQKEQDVLKIFIQDGLKNPLILDAIKDKQYEVVSKSKLERLCGNENHQGIVCLIESYEYLPFEELVRRTNDEEYPLIVMLDGVNDPHNLGAIMRTCEAIGCKSIICPKHNSVGLTSVVAKVSTGAIEKVRVACVTNLTNTLKTLKEQGFWVVGAEASGDIDYRKVDYKTKIVLVLGSEGFGISRLVFEQCDFKISLPMVGTINSLNVSNAAAILLYQIFSNRNPVK